MTLKEIFPTTIFSVKLMHDCILLLVLVGGGGLPDSVSDLISLDSDHYVISQVSFWLEGVFLKLLGVIRNLCHRLYWQRKKCKSRSTNFWLPWQYFLIGIIDLPSGLSCMCLTFLIFYCLFPLLDSVSDLISLDSDHYVTSQVSFWLEGVFLVAMALLGVIGNFVSSVILARKEMRNSFNQLLVALAIFDTTYLVSDACIFWKFQWRMSSLICIFVLGNEHRKVNQDQVSSHLQHHQTYDTEDPLPTNEHLDDSICLFNR